MNVPYTIERTRSGVKVKFTGKALCHAPEKTFTASRFSSENKMLKTAKKFAESIIDLHKQTQTVAQLRNNSDELSKKKVNIRPRYALNKTGVVGVFREYQYHKDGSKTPYAYTANYTLEGVQHRFRFPLSHYRTEEQAFQSAVAHRLFCINVQKSMLKHG